VRGGNGTGVLWRGRTRVINSYQISNAIPTLKWDKIEDATTHEVFRVMLGCLGRMRWAYPTIPVGDSAWGGAQPPERWEVDREFLTYYFPELDRREVLWRNGQLDRSIDRPQPEEATK